MGVVVSNYNGIQSISLTASFAASVQPYALPTVFRNCVYLNHSATYNDVHVYRFTSVCLIPFFQFLSYAAFLVFVLFSRIETQLVLKMYLY